VVDLPWLAGFGQPREDRVPEPLWQQPADAADQPDRDLCAVADRGRGVGGRGGHEAVGADGLGLEQDEVGGGCRGPQAARTDLLGLDVDASQAAGQPVALG
jgi:hypothetical protein